MKWQAWEWHKGESKELAAAAFLEFVRPILESYGYEDSIADPKADEKEKAYQECLERKQL